MARKTKLLNLNMPFTVLYFYPTIFSACAAVAELTPYAFCN